MKRLHIAIASMVLLGILVLVTVAHGIGGVTAAEDDRFRIKGTTLTKYLGTDTFVSVPDTVSSIGDEAFSGNETLTSIEIPSSVEQISYNAFKNCTALKGVILPASVEKVGPGAFEGCTALTSVQIGAHVRAWGSGVFANCDSLAKVTIDADNEYLTYYNGAIYNGNMTMLYQVLPAREGENYVMPETVENIDTYAFWNLQNTKNVKVSSKVAAIPRQAMSSMGSVENVVIQEPTTGIGERAIANNANLKQVVIPDSVVSIDKKAFSGSPEFKICTSKSSTADTYGNENSIEVIYKADEYPDDFMDSNAGMEQKPNVGDSSDTNTSDADNSDTNTTDTDETEDSQTTTSVTSEDDASSDDESSENKTQQKPSEFESTANYIHPLDVPEKDNVLGKTVIVAGKAVVLMDNHKGQVYGIPEGTEADVVEEASTEAETQTEPDKTDYSISVSYERSGEDSIAQRKFYKQKDLTEIQFEENIKTIGRLAFAESGLKSVVIPENVTEIEYGAFMACANLKEVTIPDTVSVIGTKAFEGTPWLKEWLDGTADTEDGDFLIVGDGILMAYRGNSEHVEIPDGVKQIGSETFKGHKEILDVAVPASVEKICAEAFRNCSSLTGLTGCEGLKTIVRGAFYGTQISEDDFKK
ncbi:MAG: leucine-rich repeat domain-containing protein [Lachnospiraceae bacterium]|nr:leucine-rich repeat domain-containing protein [Lachnospiraceae bacterium]